MNTDSDFVFRVSFTVEIIVILGMIGNVMSFIVYSRPTFRKNSISIYCRALAIFDMFIVFQAIFDFYSLLYDVYVINYSDAVCKVFTYAFYALGSIPGWILIAFSIDKALSLKSVSQGMRKPIVHYLIITCIVLANLLLYIGIPIFLKLVYFDVGGGVTVAVCDPSTLHFSSALSIIYAVESSFLPFVIMIVSSLITVKLLRDSRRQVKLTGTVADKRRSRDNKYAITSLTFNVLFVVLKLPIVIATTMGYVNAGTYFLQLASMIYFINYSSRFFVYLLTNSLFRRELILLFGFGVQIQVSGTNTKTPNRLSNTNLNTNINKLTSQVENSRV